MESHLLQMRGLKQKKIKQFAKIIASHLLQMRGLKLKIFLYLKNTLYSRIFYRCVD